MATCREALTAIAPLLELAIPLKDAMEKHPDLAGQKRLARARILHTVIVHKLPDVKV